MKNRYDILDDKVMIYLQEMDGVQLKTIRSG